MRDKIEEALKLLEGMDGDWVDHDGIRVDKCDFGRVVDMLREALQSNADDSEPITAEWCVANGAQESYPGFFAWRWAGRSVTYDSYDTSVGVRDGYNFAELWHITTRGQIRHLLAAMSEDKA